MSFLTNTKDFPSLGAGGTKRGGTGFDLDPSIFDDVDPMSSKFGETLEPPASASKFDAATAMKPLFGGEKLEKFGGSKPLFGDAEKRRKDLAALGINPDAVPDSGGPKKSLPTAGGKAADALDNFLPFGERERTQEEKRLEEELAKQNESLLAELASKEKKIGYSGGNDVHHEDDEDIDDLLGDILEDDEPIKGKIAAKKNKRQETESKSSGKDDSQLGGGSQLGASQLLGTSQLGASQLGGNQTLGGSSGLGASGIGSGGSGLGGMNNNLDLSQLSALETSNVTTNFGSANKTTKTFGSRRSLQAPEPALKKQEENWDWDSDDNVPLPGADPKNDSALAGTGLTGGSKEAKEQESKMSSSDDDFFLPMGKNDGATEAPKKKAGAPTKDRGMKIPGFGGASTSGENSPETPPIFGAKPKTASVPGRRVSMVEQKKKSPSTALGLDSLALEPQPNSARGESPLQKDRDKLKNSELDPDLFGSGSEFLKKPPRRTLGSTKPVEKDFVKAKTVGAFPGVPDSSEDDIKLSTNIGGGGGAAPGRSLGSKEKKEGEKDDFFDFLLNEESLTGNSAANAGGSKERVRRDLEKKDGPNKRMSRRQSALVQQATIGNRTGSKQATIAEETTAVDAFLDANANLLSGTTTGSALKPPTSDNLNAQGGAVPSIQGIGAISSGTVIDNNRTLMREETGTATMLPITATTGGQPTILVNDLLLKQQTEYQAKLDAQTDTIKELKAELAVTAASLAASEAKSKRAENDVEEMEARNRTSINKMQLEIDADRERWGIERKRLENDMERLKTAHQEEIRHLQESKRTLTESIDIEKEHVRRNEQRMSREETERVRRIMQDEQQEIEKRHQRQISILRESQETEIESVKKSMANGIQINSLLEKVHDTTFAMDMISKKLETQRSIEDQVREKTLDNREKMIRATEKQLVEQQKEMELQRRKMTELIKRMEDELSEGKNQSQLANERLDREHSRLLELQRTLKQEKYMAAQSIREDKLGLDTEKRNWQREQVERTEQLNSRERELNAQEERVKALEQMVESSRINCDRRIRESENLISSERRNIIVEMERLEEKKREFQIQEDKHSAERNALENERKNFENEVQGIKAMAEKLDERRKVVENVYLQGCEIQEENKKMAKQIEMERANRGNEIQRLKALQHMIERQRLELVQDTINTGGGGGAIRPSPGGQQGVAMQNFMAEYNKEMNNLNLGPIQAKNSVYVPAPDFSIGTASIPRNGVSNAWGTATPGFHTSADVSGQADEWSASKQRARLNNVLKLGNDGSSSSNSGRQNSANLGNGNRANPLGNDVIGSPNSKDHLGVTNPSSKDTKDNDVEMADPERRAFNAEMERWRVASEGTQRHMLNLQKRLLDEDLRLRAVEDIGLLTDGPTDGHGIDKPNVNSFSPSGNIEAFNNLEVGEESDVNETKEDLKNPDPSLLMSNDNGNSLHTLHPLSDNKSMHSTYRTYQ